MRQSRYSYPSHERSRRARWLVPGVAVMILAGCGGSSGPEPGAAPVEATRGSQDSGTPDGAGVVSTAAATTTAASSMSPQPYPVFVVGISPAARRDPDARSRAGGSSSSAESLTRLLDAEPPRGTAGAPVVVVVPGALPADSIGRPIIHGSVQPQGGVK